MASHFRQTEDVASERTGGRSDASRRRNEQDAPSTPTGRHARKTSEPPHGTSASVTGAFQRLDPSVTGSFAALSSADLRPISAPATADDDAPRPIGVDPSVTGSFARVTPEMAARAVTRDTAAEAAEAARKRQETNGRRLSHAGRPEVASRQAAAGGSRRALVGVALAVVVLVAGGLFVRHALTTPRDDAPAQGNAVAMPEGAVEVAGTVYLLVDADGGTHTLVARAAGGAADVGVATIYGEPGQLLAYEESVIIPESYADGTWDVIAYTPGGDALAAQVVDGEGQPVHGEGAIVEARLEGSDLVIVDSTGATTTVSLAAPVAGE